MTEAACVFSRRGTKSIEAVKAFAPYDKLVRQLPDMRESTVRLVTQAVKEDRRAYVLVNNRSEGHAPGTVKALHGMLTQHITVADTM